MSLTDETRTLERRTFFDGQRLRASDLNDQESFHREMRWLHNRSLHQPGVGNGYALSGAKDDREVVVGPGYALDAYGHEIVLVRQTTVSVPPVASDEQGRPISYYLAVRYPSDARLNEAETRQGLCGARGPVRLIEQPEIIWVRLGLDPLKPMPTALVPRDPTLRDGVASGVIVVLALVEVFQCRLNAPISAESLAPRRSARPPKLPYTASGVELAPNWIVEPTGFNTAKTGPAGFYPTAFRLRATVKTTAATFGDIPRYLVRVEGQNVIGLPLGSASPTGHALLDSMIDLDLDPTATNHLQFTVRVTPVIWIDPASTAQPDWDLMFASPPDLQKVSKQFGKTWSIVWVGIEG